MMMGKEESLFRSEELPKMYDLSAQFEKFYRECVVLSYQEQQRLHEKKKLNMKRLNDGLSTYNKENGTSFRVVESRVQGSMAMATVVQNDNSDYDIDVAVVIDGENIYELGARKARKIIYDALSLKDGQFKEAPELKTNCVRIYYSDGYHIDFAIYRRSLDVFKRSYCYEHSGGTEWAPRDPLAITTWFQNEDRKVGHKLRQVVRLSKMFCKSRKTWGDMPGGLLQAVLCQECFAR